MNNALKKYFSKFPTAARFALNKVRDSILEVAPECEEVIAYGIPTLKYDGKNLVHFGAFKKHIGFYPTSIGVSVFKDELSEYKFSKGAIQFQLHEPIPVQLIKKIVGYRLSKLKGEAKKNPKKKALKKAKSKKVSKKGVGKKVKRS